MTKETLLEWGLSEEQAGKVLSEWERAEAVRADELKAMKIASAVDFALSAAKAKNITAARALMAGFMEKAEVAGDGSVPGLDEEIRKLVESPDTAFLFDTAPKRTFRGAKPAEKSDSGAMTLEKLRAMSPAERRKFSLNSPDEYKQLYYGGNA